ncbi:unnamed protein product [Closterium sp. NIES-65]|nr:unnamed protein product [Closterium sp. NIES-65]
MPPKRTTKAAVDVTLPDDLSTDPITTLSPDGDGAEKQGSDITINAPSATNIAAGIIKESATTAAAVVGGSRLTVEEKSQDNQAPTTVNDEFLEDDEDEELEIDIAKEDAFRLRYTAILLIPMVLSQEIKAIIAAVRLLMTKYQKANAPVIKCIWQHTEDATYLKEKAARPLAIEVIFRRVPANIVPDVLKDLLVRFKLKMRTQSAFKEGVGFHRVAHPLTGADTDMSEEKWKPLAGRKLDAEAAAELAADWSEAEVKQAIKALADGKSPGKDGLPKELFEKHWDVLGKEFLHMAQSFAASASIPASIKEAVTILLHKKGEKENQDTYRPITLLNFTYKVLAWVVANRMKPHLHKVISAEQYGFIPGRRISDAIGVVADVIEAAKKGNEDWYMLLVDFRKAFDSVSRSFLFSALKEMGFPERFVGWVEGLHKDTRTRLLIKGWLGEAVEVKSGTKKCKSVILPIGHNIGRRLGTLGGFKWAKADEAERVLGVWVTPSGSSEPTWKRAFEKIIVELIKWKALFLTIAARVVIINCYITPRIAYQAQVYPPIEEIWKKLMKLIHNFLTGNNASAEKGFVLWNWGLLTTPKAGGGLGVLDPEILLACVAARRIGCLLLEENGKKKEIMLKAAGLPLGEDTFLAHEWLLKHWLGDNERWLRMCETFMNSPIADTGKSSSREDVAQKRVVFNRKLLLNGTNPVGGQKEAKGLWETRLRDLVTARQDGAAEIKNIVTLERELRSRDSARLALKALDAVPQEWKAVLAPDARGEGVVSGVQNSSDISGGRKHAAATIFRSAVFTNGQLSSLKQLRESWAKPDAVLTKQEKWSGKWSGKIDWEWVIRTRNSLVIPNRPRDVLTRIHNHNLQVGERVDFLSSKPKCPYCGEIETQDHCLFNCPMIEPVVSGLRRALRMLNPTRTPASLGDLLFQETGTTSDFPEATLTAITFHQLWGLQGAGWDVMGQRGAARGRVGCHEAEGGCKGQSGTTWGRGGLQGAEWDNMGQRGVSRGRVGCHGAEGGCKGQGGMSWGRGGLQGAEWDNMGQRGVARGRVGCHGAEGGCKGQGGMSWGRGGLQGAGWDVMGQRGVARGKVGCHGAEGGCKEQSGTTWDKGG